MVVIGLVVGLVVGLLVPTVPEPAGAARGQVGCGTAAGSTGIGGTVRDAVSGSPVAEAYVAVLRASDQAMVAGVAAGTDGRFSVAVPAGVYFLYLLDPSGGHTARMHGSPTAVTVTGGAVSSVDAQMAPRRGSLTGRVTDEGTGQPVAGAWAVTVNWASGTPERVAVADAGGRFVLDQMAVGAHMVVYVDPAGAHEPEYFGGTPSPVGAVPVQVGAGAATEAAAALAARAAPATTTAVDGVVTERGGGPLAGVMVVALRARDYRLAAGTRTDAAGGYHLALAAGDYKLGFLDPTGEHPMVWHAGQRHDGLGAATTVHSPATVDAAMDPVTGAVAGTVVDDPTEAGVGCIWVVAIDGSGSVWGPTATGGDGTYRLGGLVPGTYRLAMVDPTGGRIQEYWHDSPSFAGATPLAVAAGATTPADGALTAAAPFGAPTQWVARQFTELLGRPPTPGEWKVWTDYYGALPACTSASLMVLPMYLTGLTTPTVPGLPSGRATEFDTLYPAATPLDRALRAAAVVRAAYGHEANDNDWTSTIKPYVAGTATWSGTVNRLYSFILAFVGPATFCSSTTPAYPFGFSRTIDLRAKVMALYPNLSPPLAPSRTQAQLVADLQAASGGATVAQRTVTLRQGEIVRIGGSTNANQQLVVPAGVTLTSEGRPPYTEPTDATPQGLAYERMGRIVADTTPGAAPGLDPADGRVCAGTVCNNIGLLALAPGAHLTGVWVDGQGLSGAQYKVALVQTAGSAAESAATPYDDGTSVIASRLSEPPRDGTGLRLAGASTGTPCVNEKVLGNLVTGYSSSHQFDQRGQAQWVDGITVSCEDAVVAANGVVDVTDLGIVVNGAMNRNETAATQRSDVRANTVLSAGLDTHVALGADAVGQCLAMTIDNPAGTPVPGTPVPCLDVRGARDFSGARIRDNRFFSSTRTSFDVALMVGGGALWGDHRFLNQAPDADHPGATGVAVTGNTTGGVPTRANIGIDVHDMTDATVTGNTTTFRLVDGNPRSTWGKCPQANLLAGTDELASLSTDASFVGGDGSRGCVIGEPPAAGLERLRVSDDGSAFVGTVTGSAFRVWGGDLSLDPDIEVMTDDFRDVRRMGLNVIRLLLDTEDYLVAPTCDTCPPTVDTAAVDHLGDVATAAEQVGLYLDITGNGIATHHHNHSWFDDLSASPEDEVRRWQAQELFWQAVAAELRPHTSVAWYDLVNEPTLPVSTPAATWCFDEDMAPDDFCWNPNVVKSYTDPADTSRQRSQLEVARAWTTRMRDAVKVGAGDTAHPVSVGQLSFCGGALNRASREIADFDMVHMYPEDSTLTADINTVNNCKQPGRPLVVEETFWTASATNLELFVDSTQARTAGYLGHILQGTPSQILEFLWTHPPSDPGWWPRVLCLAWDQFSLRQVALRNPTGPGIMPS